MMDCFAYRLGGGEHGAHALVLSQLHGVLPLCLFARTQDTCPHIAMEPPNSIFTISVSQVLEEALTTSKAMTGRRLLDCGLSPGRRLGLFDWVKDKVIDPAVKIAEEAARLAKEAAELLARHLLVCDLLRGFKVTWDAAKDAAVDAVEDAAKKAAATATTLLNEAQAATRAVQNAANAAAAAATAAAAAAAATATKLLNEAKAATRAVENAASVAAAAATSTLNEVKDAAETAAATATKFIDDVGNAFSELGKEIQCAAPLPPPAPL